MGEGDFSGKADGEIMRGQHQDVRNVAEGCGDQLRG